jgi:hypothetical protein
MLELSYLEVFMIAFVSFTVGMIYEYIASYFDYNTGKWVGRRYSNTRDKDQ